MDEINPLGRAAHKVFRIKYHFVFVIKYRKDLFLDQRYVDFFERDLFGNWREIFDYI